MEAKFQFRQFVGSIVITHAKTCTPRAQADADTALDPTAAEEAGHVSRGGGGGAAGVKQLLVDEGRERRSSSEEWEKISTGEMNLAADGGRQGEDDATEC